MRKFSFFGDQIDQFEDGSDLFDMRGSGLQFSDLAIDNDGDFGPTISSDRGQITVGDASAVFIDESDFLFDAPLAPLSSFSSSARHADELLRPDAPVVQSPARRRAGSTSLLRRSSWASTSSKPKRLVQPSRRSASAGA